MSKRANTTPKPTRRVFMVGAGVSKEVGAPLIGDFWDELLRCVPESRTYDLKLFLRTHVPDRNIEEVLGDIDASVFKGAPLSGYSIPRLRGMRSKIVNAICDTLTAVQYSFLDRHYDYKRYEDPYFYWARDFKAVDRGKARASRHSSRREREVARERSTLRPGRTFDELTWLDYEKHVYYVFDNKLSKETSLYLRAAAIAAGRTRFIAWLTELWPLFLYWGCGPLKMKERACTGPIRRDCVERFLKVLHDPAARAVKYVDGWPKRRLVGLLKGWKSEGGLTEELLEKCAFALRKGLFPTLVGNAAWVKRQVARLLDSGPGQINPYVLLAALWKSSDAVKSLNYDLFPESAVSMLYPHLSIDYCLRDLIGITPWAPQGEPFELYGPSGQN